MVNFLIFSEKLDLLNVRLLLSFYSPFPKYIHMSRGFLRLFNYQVY